MIGNAASQNTVIQEIVIDALLSGVVLPLFVAIVAVGAIRFGLVESIGQRLAAGAIAIGMLASIAAMAAWPPFPPISASQKLGYLVLLGVVLGTLLDLVGKPAGFPRFRLLSILLWPTIVVGWIGWRQIAALDPVAMVQLALIDLAGIVLLWRLYDEPGPAPNAPVALIAASVGAAIIALIGHASLISQYYGALAAATGGYVLWNWPSPRDAFGAAGVLGAGGAFLALTTIMVQFTETNTLALAFVLLVFLCPVVARATRYGKGSASAPVATAVICLVPVALALAIVIIMEQDALNSLF